MVSKKPNTYKTFIYLIPLIISMSNKPRGQVVEMPDNKYVALLDLELDDIAPILASSEQTKNYLLADGIFKKLLEETKQVVDEETGEVTTVFHPDLKYWFDQKVKISNLISKTNIQAGVNEAELTLQLMNVLPKYLTEEQKKEIGKQILKKKVMKNVGN